LLASYLGITLHLTPYVPIPYLAEKGQEQNQTLRHSLKSIQPSEMLLLVMYFHFKSITFQVKYLIFPIQIMLVNLRALTSKK